LPGNANEPSLDESSRFLDEVNQVARDEIVSAHEFPQV
jgi:hypothetical protein